MRDGRPLAAVATGSLFAAAAVRFGPHAVLPAFCLFFAVLVAVAAADVEHRVVPNRILRPALVATVPLLGGAAALEGAGRVAVDSVAGGAIAFLGLALVHFVHPRGLGFGDVRLAGFIGLYLGWLGLAHVAVGLILAFVLALAGGLVLMATTGAGLTARMPFAPFLAGGAVLAVLWGGPLIRAWSG